MSDPQAISVPFEKNSDQSGVSHLFSTILTITLIGLLANINTPFFHGTVLVAAVDGKTVTSNK